VIDTVQAMVDGYATLGFPPLQIVNGRIETIWVLGNNYRNRSKLYGAYPGNYLKRVMSMFPDKTSILHLFSGSVPKDKSYTRFCNTGADVNGDAEKLSTYFAANQFDLIVADPPYSVEDAEHYGTPMIGRTLVLQECLIILKKGGHIVWLDQVLPMWSKRNLKLVGLIGIVISTNHRFRIASVFEKV
jgi:hypothetical protein